MPNSCLNTYMKRQYIDVFALYCFLSYSRIIDIHFENAIRCVIWIDWFPLSVSWIHNEIECIGVISLVIRCVYHRYADITHCLLVNLYQIVGVFRWCFDVWLLILVSSSPLLTVNAVEEINCLCKLLRKNNIVYTNNVAVTFFGKMNLLKNDGFCWRIVCQYFFQMLVRQFF